MAAPWRDGGRVGREAGPPRHTTHPTTTPPAPIPLCGEAVCCMQDVAEDQQLLARLVHNLQAEGGDTDEQFGMLCAAQVRALGWAC